MSDLNSPILIAGPTASGKSALALALAESTGGVVINADALQVYNCWQILSARPDAAELARAPHRLFGHISADTLYSTGQWLREVQRVMAEAETTGRRPIIVGGTGLYFSALTEGLAEIPEIPGEIRARGNRLREAGGTGAMLIDLERNDPQTLQQIDARNPARVQRAWEVFTATGTGLAEWQKNTPLPLVAPASATCVVVYSDRDRLAERIERRFDLMIKAGALDEVRSVVNAGWNPELPSSRAIGARALAACLHGEITLERAVELAKTQTRQYAKRQRTWFRNRMAEWRWLHCEKAADDPGTLLKSADLDR